MTRWSKQDRKPLVQRPPHNPQAVHISNPAIYRWSQKRAA